MWKVFSRRRDAVRVELPAKPSKGETNRQFFEDLWKRGDYWQLESDPFEAAKYAKQMELIAGRRYGRALEIGCGAGVFTRMLATVCDRVVAIDVSPKAIERAGIDGKTRNATAETRRRGGGRGERRWSD